MYRFPFLCVILLALWLTACEYPYARVEVVNESKWDLKEIVVAGSGFSDTVPVLRPGDSHILRVHPVGESGISLTFRSGAEQITTPEKGRFKRSYNVQVRITPENGVLVGSSVRTHWIYFLLLDPEILLSLLLIPIFIWLWREGLLIDPRSRWNRR